MSYRVRRDDERTNCQILTGGYMDCSEDESRIVCNMLGSMSHRHDKRSEYHMASKIDSYLRGWSRCREEILDPVNFRRHRSTKRRHSWRSGIRSKLKKTSRSSSGKSHSSSLDKCCGKCNLTSKYDCGTKQVANKRKKWNLACKSHVCLERRSTYFTEDSY